MLAATQSELDSHSTEVSAHHIRYTDAEAVAAATNNGFLTTVITDDIQNAAVTVNKLAPNIIEIKTDLQTQIDTLQAKVLALETLTTSMTAELDNVYFTGVNVHVRDGTGTIGCDPCTTGLGNLIVGYDEEREAGSDKSGSHNLVVGPKHNYESYGGLITGERNTVSGINSSVSGGLSRMADSLNDWVAGRLFQDE